MRHDSIQTRHISLTFFSEQKQNKHKDWTAAKYREIKQISFDTWLLPIYQTHTYIMQILGENNLKL